MMEPIIDRALFNFRKGIISEVAQNVAGKIIPVRDSGNGMAYNTGTEIRLPYSHYTEEDIKEVERKLFEDDESVYTYEDLIGLGLHEGLHTFFNSFDISDDAKKILPENPNFAHMIFNMVEDSRINAGGKPIHTGWSMDLEQLHERMIRKRLMTIKDLDPNFTKKTEDAFRVLIEIVTAISAKESKLVQKYISKKVRKDPIVVSFVRKMHRVFKKLWESLTLINTIIASKEIIEYFKDYLKKPIEMPNPMSSPAKGKPSKKGKGQKGEGGQKGSGEGSGDKKDDKDDKKDGKSDGKGSEKKDGNDKKDEKSGGETGDKDDEKKEDGNGSSGSGDENKEQKESGEQGSSESSSKSDEQGSSESSSKSGEQGSSESSSKSGEQGSSESSSKSGEQKDSSNKKRTQSSGEDSAADMSKPKKQERSGKNDKSNEITDLSEFDVGEQKSDMPDKKTIDRDTKDIIEKALQRAETATSKQIEKLFKKTILKLKNETEEKIEELKRELNTPKPKPESHPDDTKSYDAELPEGNTMPCDIRRSLPALQAANGVYNPIPLGRKIKKEYAGLIRGVQNYLRKLKVRDTWIGDQKRGRIDIKKLPTMIIDKNTTKVFQRKETKDGASVLVLIDESGSMDGSKIIRARDAGMVLGEALNGTRIDFSLIGFCAGSSTMRIMEKQYKMFGEKLRAEKIATISCASGYHHNRDGTSIRFATRHFKKVKPTDKKILIVVSDGQPCHLGYGGMEGNKDTANAIREARSQGIHVFAVSIDQSSTAATYLEPAYGRGNWFQVNSENLKNQLLNLAKRIAKAVV
jgi:hypothetical protein